MLTTYLPVLRAPTAMSLDWYKEFHNIYYLSQITNMVLLSYMDTFIELNSKAVIFDEKMDYLVKKGIVSATDEDGKNVITILNEDAFRSIDIEDVVAQIINDRLKNAVNDMVMRLAAIGLEFNEVPHKEIAIDINKLRKSTDATNWYGIIKGFLNVWEYLFLYGIVETTMKKLLNKSGIVREEDLMNDIMDKYNPLESLLENNLSLCKDMVISLWTLYTDFRNIYSHSHGIMTQYAKSTICGKLDKVNNDLERHDAVISLTAYANIFQKDSLTINKFYLIKDAELNVFRNLTISLMENLDQISQERLIET